MDARACSLLVAFALLPVSTLEQREFERLVFPPQRESSRPLSVVRAPSVSSGSVVRVSEHTVQVQAPGLIPEYTGHSTLPRDKTFSQYKSVYVPPPVEHIPYGSQPSWPSTESPSTRQPSPPSATKAPAPTNYEINYCDRNEFPDETLAQYSLYRVEYFIYNASCSPVFFQCSIGQTFLLKCPSEDEAFDVSTVNCNFKNSVKYCGEYDHVMHCTVRESCTDNEFACCSAPQKCIPLTARCDGHMDCFDSADENDCPSCKRDEFACVKSGTCIPSSMRCDGHTDDCLDGSNLDEIGCSRNSTCVGKFVCSSSRTGPSCVDYTKHCDGTKDCDGGEDEVNCKLAETKYLLCENQKQSVTKQQWCDSTPDCEDGSDEKYCY